MLEADKLESRCLRKVQQFRAMQARCNNYRVKIGFDYPKERQSKTWNIQARTTTSFLTSLI